MMLPESSVETSFQRTRYANKTWFVDKERGRIVKECDGMDAIVQAVKKILQTERYSERIYSTRYGVEFNAMIGKSLDYVKASLPQNIKEALQQDDRVQSVSISNIQAAGDAFAITIDVRTNAGAVTVTGVLGDRNG